MLCRGDPVLSDQHFLKLKPRRGIERRGNFPLHYTKKRIATNKQLKDTRPVALDYKTGSDCGIEFNFNPRGIYAFFNTGPVDSSGEILGFWAADIDDHKDDTHLFVKPSSTAGLSALESKAN